MAAHGHFHWNELLARNIDGAKDFYAKTIGWSYQPMTMADGATYWLAMLDGQPVAGIYPIDRPEFDGVPECWMSYLAVDDVDARVKKARRRRRQADEADLRRSRCRADRRPDRAGRRGRRLDDAGELTGELNFEVTNS